ncbi:hypothetical protein TNCV_703261 [Trichonephila clavipes]|nr:hypothetical protein TNCV_703261 [Trichonephila clavipes]
MLSHATPVPWPAALDYMGPDPSHEQADRDGSTDSRLGLNQEKKEEKKDASPRGTINDVLKISGKPQNTPIAIP